MLWLAFTSAMKASTRCVNVLPLGSNAAAVVVAASAMVVFLWSESEASVDVEPGNFKAHAIDADDRDVLDVADTAQKHVEIELRPAPIGALQLIGKHRLLRGRLRRWLT